MPESVSGLQKYIFVLFGRIYNTCIAILVPNKAFLTDVEPDLMARIEREYPRIKKEFIAIQENQLTQIDDVLEENKTLNTEKKWRFLLLKSYYVDYTQNQQKVPVTSSLIGDPRICSAFFSVLAPHSNIPEHRGPFKGVLRVHLPLLVPADSQNCYIVVNGEKRAWELGKCLVFDDHYKHYVVNKTDEYRVVLFMDILRPLPFPIRPLNTWIVSVIRNSGYVKSIRQKMKPTG